ncbi:hypothetical protein N0V93_003802 [Gnomoniopsis smithogilvyi]|uniref:HMG box domain-containing protein n=1 Tax=Gnomoniopsis smithogilvyi TaxID=1191159 RepID=A0A9W8YZA2_9PEZI|nr:hypothetical protein N0V93_003802 [Gnomoniopsis smithogilvyi]
MSPRLDEIFGELGITQYLDAFVDQGFDTWETILDITESDLDALGVKLGHRRKLQRRIANARGIAPNAVLASPLKPTVEDAPSDTNRPDVPAALVNGGREAGMAVVQKRKYRRHPKPDENAPERPPSAYVLFSNKMREDLKGQNLTFTEIAKLVGENWQGLTQAEKEPFEQQAQKAKEKYNHDLAEYKQTAGYKKYLQYLQDFKAKHANPHEKENAKRVRLSDPSATEPNGNPTHAGSIGRVGSIGETHSGPSGSRQRIGSIVSNGESCYAPSILSGSMRTPTEESSAFSPNGGYFDRREHSPGFSVSPRDSSAPPSMPPIRRDPSYIDGFRQDSLPQTRHLPSLSDMFDGRQMPNGLSYSSEQSLPPNPTVLPRAYHTASPAHTPSTCGSESRPPSLKKEASSGGSLSSGSSYSSYPRTPVEGSLPIHALLSNAKQLGPPDIAYATNPAIYRSTSPDERGLSAQYPPEVAPGDLNAARQGMPHSNGHSIAPSHISNAPPPRYQLGYPENRAPAIPASSLGPSPSTGVPTPVPATRPGGKPDAGLDGISALLQADKFVERR